MNRLRAWWRHWRWKQKRRDLEVFLFNSGPVGKWAAIRDENSTLNVWKGWPL